MISVKVWRLFVYNLHDQTRKPIALPIIIKLGNIEDKCGVRDLMTLVTVRVCRPKVVCNLGSNCLWTPTYWEMSVAKALFIAEGVAALEYLSSGARRR